MEQIRQKHRIIYLDVLRVLACCMIVLMHSPHPDAGNPGVLLVPLSFITAAGIGLFFMVSGALLLPVKTDTTSFLKKRFGKIVGPLLFWTLFYLGLSVISGEKPVSSLPHALTSIPFSKQGHGVLWFLYTLAGLYLLSPIISPFLEKASRRELSLYLILWAIALCFPIFANVVDVDSGPTGMLYYFSGYVGYFLLGYYLHTYKPQIPFYMTLFMLVVPVICLLLAKMFYDKDGILSDYFWYLSIFVAMMCVAWFDGVKRFVSKCKLGEGGSHILQKLSDCCFGIYLVHIFIMRYILWDIDWIVHGFGGVGQIFITWVLTFLLSFAVTYLISMMPYSEYIVGFRQKKK